MSTVHKLVSEPAPLAVNAKDDLTIGDLAREFGVTLRALRFYEHRGLLTPRRQGMSRLYDAKDRARLGLILKGKQLGFTLTEIQALLAANQDDVTKVDLPLTREQMQAQLEQLRTQRDQLNEAIRELETKLGKSA
ncbi:MAG: MerR family transcriptional regulator [Beijerinckiaceae bacterium]